MSKSTIPSTRMENRDDNLALSDSEGWDMILTPSGYSTPEIVSLDGNSDEDVGTPIGKQSIALEAETVLGGQSSGSDVGAWVLAKALNEGETFELKSGVSGNEAVASIPILDEALKAADAIQTELSDDHSTPSLSDQRVIVKNDIFDETAWHELQQLGLVEDLSGIMKISKIPGTDPSRFRGLGVTPSNKADSNDIEFASLEVSDHVKNGDMTLRPAGPGGYYQIVPPQPFPVTSTYTEIYCDPTMAQAIRSAPAEEPSEVAGSFRTVKRRVGPEFKEDLYVTHDEITRSVMDGKRTYTFKVLSVEPTHQSDDPTSTLRMKFFKDNIEDRTCHLMYDACRTYLMRVDDGTGGGMEFVTDHDFGIEIECGNDGTSTTQGKVWPNRWVKPRT